jgi:hypothetical protein
MGKNPDQGSRMNIPDHFSESVETNFFGLTILEFFDVDPGSSRTRIPDGKIPSIQKTWTLHRGGT